MVPDTKILNILKMLSKGEISAETANNMMRELEGKSQLSGTSQESEPRNSEIALLSRAYFSGTFLPAIIIDFQAEFEKRENAEAVLEEEIVLEETVEDNEVEQPEELQQEEREIVPENKNLIYEKPRILAPSSFEPAVCSAGIAVFEQDEQKTDEQETSDDEVELDVTIASEEITTNEEVDEPLGSVESPVRKPTVFDFYSEENAEITEFRRLTRNVRRSKNPQVSSIMMTSAMKDEGKSLVSANLVITIAKKEPKKNVLLMD